MARTPPQFAQLMDEPTIIVDPSLYLPPPRTALGVLRDVSFGVARAVIVSMLAGATVFSVAHVLKHQTLTHGLHQHRLEEVVVRVQAARAAPSFVGVAEQVAFASSVAPVTTRPMAASPRVHDAEPSPSLGVEQARLLVATSAVPDEADAAEADAASEAEAASEDKGESVVSPQELMARVRTGRRYLGARRFEEAESAFREVLEVRAGHPAALSGLARLSLARGKLDDALQFAERSVQSAPYQAAYHVVLGDVLRASGNSLAAQTEYELAQQLRPERRLDAAERALPPNPF